MVGLKGLYLKHKPKHSSSIDFHQLFLIWLSSSSLWFLVQLKMWSTEGSGYFTFAVFVLESCCYHSTEEVGYMLSAVVTALKRLHYFSFYSAIINVWKYEHGYEALLPCSYFEMASEYNICCGEQKHWWEIFSSGFCSVVKAFFFATSQCPYSWGWNSIEIFKKWWKYLEIMRESTEKKSKGGQTGRRTYG